MILTLEAIQKTVNLGALTNKQKAVLRECFGSHWQATKGWQTQLVGRYMSGLQYARLCALKKYKPQPEQTPELPQFRAESPEAEINAIYLANRSEFE